MNPFIWANWNAPTHVHALTTTIHGGIGTGLYGSNNLALHVEDNAEEVLMNRKKLMQALNFTAEPIWLNQTHSTHVCVVEEDTERDQVDASITRLKNVPLVILTADCLPIVLCNQNGTEIAAIHAGWRGLLNGIIQNTCDKMHSQSASLMAWIGPAICQNCYEVGESVKNQFIERYPFTKNTFKDRYANLAYMAELILNSLGITQVFQSGLCTFEEKKSVLFLSSNVANR